MRTNPPGKPPNRLSHWPPPEEKVTRALLANLHGLPHRFERLVFVAALQNPETRDQLCGLPLDHDWEKVSLILCREHREIFEEWLGLYLEDKMADLEAYASGRGESVANIAQRWLSPDQRDYLVPSVALPPEKRLFQIDVETLLMILASKA